MLSLKEDPKNKLQVLGALVRLRQICVDPSSFIENFRELSPKLEYVIELIKTSISAKHKILVFSQFTTVLEHLKELLEKEKIPNFYIYGGTSPEDRLDLCSKFNASNKYNVMLISLKAGGTGLNLHGADIVIHLDPWWNFAVEEQANDRAHRIGQTRPVTVYKLVAHDSIEERIITLQESKKDLYEQVVKSGTESITNFSDDDLKYLLS